MLLEARDLQVGYALPVCPPVSFTVGPGEALAVVGVNGSGKSTVLRTVLGQIPALGGQVRLDGHAVDPRTARHRAAVAHDLGDEVFLPGLCAAEHLELTALGHGVADPGAAAADLLEEMGLTARARARPAALSSGQRRRLLLAAALVRPRELLVLDEPESRLDTSARHRMADRLADEREAGGAVLFASHDPATVQLAATAVLVLGDEEVRLTGPEDGADVVAGL